MIRIKAEAEMFSPLLALWSQKTERLALTYFVDISLSFLRLCKAQVKETLVIMND
jgi:hypothetical protein